ncbi:MAG: hypothetical protein ACKPKO_57670, partial [Candidatus Fonsibacter sp.]
ILLLLLLIGDAEPCRVTVLGYPRSYIFSGSFVLCSDHSPGHQHPRLPQMYWKPIAEHRCEVLVRHQFDIVPAPE